MTTDKALETARYEESALQVRERFKFDSLAEHLKAPYKCYIEHLLTLIQPHHKVLEIGAGTGNFTQFLLNTHATILASDISPKSIDVIKSMYATTKLTCMVLDMEELDSFGEFDFIVSAGSLSYGNNEAVLKNIHRALKPGGYFICVDSLDNNLIYRTNRFVHYLRGNRTFSTLRRMPNMNLLERYQKTFETTEIKYFGCIVWLVPVLSKIWDGKKVAKIVSKVDSLVGVESSAFKFVMAAKKKI